MNTRIALAASTATLALALTACSTTTPSGAASDSASPAVEPTVSVAAEMYAFAWIAQQVGGDLAEVTQLVPAGADIHSYELSPQEVDALSHMDVAITTANASHAVDDAVALAGLAHVIDVSTVITLQPVPEKVSAAVATATEEEHDHAAEASESAHADEDGHAEEAGHDEAAHDHGSFDPHTWLNIHEMPLVVQEVVTAFSAVDPANAATFEANGAALTATFNELDDAYATGLSQCEQTTFVVTHPAFGYIANSYGLTQVGITGVDEDTEPSPQRLEEITAVITATGTHTIFFPDASASESVADALASEMGLTVGKLDQLIGADEGEDYVSIAEANLESLRTALGCA